MHRSPGSRPLLIVFGFLVAGCTSPVPVNEGNAPLLEAIAAVVPHRDAPSTDPSPPPPSPYQNPSMLNARAATQSAPSIGTGSPPHLSSSSPPLITGAPPQLPNHAPSVAGDPQSLQRIMAELQSLGTVDPATQRQLIADLQQTDPALWPMLMQTFRAGVAYRQRATDASTQVVVSLEKADVEGATSSARSATPTSRTSTVNATSLAATAQPTPSQPTTSLPSVESLVGNINPRGGNSPGLSFPATALLNAALEESQRREAESHRPLPPVESEAPAQPPQTEVQTVSHQQPLPDAAAKAIVADDPDWRKTVARAIDTLEAETREPPHTAQEVTRHAWLRMLYLAADRRDDALKPIPGIAAVEQDFWSEQLYALATYLDTQKLTDPARRSAETAKHLSKAAARLSEASTLTVKNLAFCTEVSSYGVYVKFKSDEFKANQPLILYAEVENFKSDETAKGFHTALRSSYQILDAQGRRVAENDLALTEEYCQNLRRDYFLRYFLSVPERIYAGRYTLQLTIVDTLSQKIGQSSIEFTVVDK